MELKDIHTKDIIPVELNAILCKNARLLSKFYLLLDQDEKSQKFEDWGNSFQYSINTVLWNRENGIWFDYDIRNKKHRNAFYPSNMMPLWAECYS